MSPVGREELVGELKNFIEALAYMFLLSEYGQVPLPSYPIQGPSSRTSDQYK